MRIALALAVNLPAVSFAFHAPSPGYFGSLHGKEMRNGLALAVTLLSVTFA
jgi:hypothetical protein